MEIDSKTARLAPARRTPDRRRRRRRIVVLLLVAALIAPAIAAATAIEAQQQSDDLFPVRGDGVRNGDFAYFVDPATRRIELADDIVRLDVGDDNAVLMRANDAVYFKVCERNQDPDADADGDLAACRSQGHDGSAGGTCGAAVEFKNDNSKPPVHGHEYVVTVCANS